MSHLASHEGTTIMLRTIKLAFVGVCTTMALTAAIAPQRSIAAEPTWDSQLQDRAAIQNLIVKYAHAYDALDADAYAAVFAEDARFTFGGNTLTGLAAIRNIITQAQQRRASVPAAEASALNFHSISNTLIEFVNDHEAHHRSYWQVVNGPAGGPFTVVNMGVYEDVIVKRDGEWLIQTRLIP